MKVSASTGSSSVRTVSPRSPYPAMPLCVTSAGIRSEEATASASVRVVATRLSTKVRW